MKCIVVLHSDDGQRYGATVPDLPGCFSGRDTLDGALERVREAVDLHAEGLIKDASPVPMSQTMSQHQANPDYAGGVWAVVDVRVETYLGPAEKIDITVPRLVLARIDEFSKKNGQSRRGSRVEAARTAMHA